MGFALRADESDVLAGVCAYLEVEPMVALGWRANGVSRGERGQRQVYSHRMLCANRPATVVDVMGVMRGGLALAIEVKRPGGWPQLKTLDRYVKTRPFGLRKDAQRHLEQWMFLRAVHEAGGHAGVAESVSDAQQIIHERAPLGLFADHPRGR